MSFDPIQNPVDYVILAGQRSPGICELSDADSPRRWDERRGYGLSGSTVVFRGLALSEFSLKVVLTTSEDFAAWHAWSPIVQRPPLGARPRALDIQHPILEDIGIRAVVVLNVSQPTQVEDGKWEYVIKLKEYRKPRPALSVPDGSDTTARPSDPYDLEIERLSAENQRLARELHR